MNTSYVILMLAGMACSAVLLALQLRSRRIAPGWAAVNALISCVLGVVCAKLVYSLILVEYYWLQGNVAEIFSANISEFSFFGGCIGIVLGAAATARLAGKPVKTYLDAFAAPFALMVAFGRLAEYFLEECGVRIDIETEFLQRFPFAVMNEWEEWCLAVFLFEAVAALIIGLIALLQKKDRPIPGLTLLRTVFYLCLWQIFFESLRSDSIRWGFVRSEQLLSAVAYTAILFIHCKKQPVRGAFKKYWPMLLDVLCIGVVIMIEFDLDKHFLNLDIFQDYAVMILVLLVLTWAEKMLVKRRRAAAA